MQSNAYNLCSALFLLVVVASYISLENESLSYDNALLIFGKYSWSGAVGFESYSIAQLICIKGFPFSRFSETMSDIDFPLRLRLAAIASK